MFEDTYRLAQNVCAVYTDLIDNLQSVPRVFSSSDFNGEQILFYLDDLELNRAEENDFLSFLINSRVATCYARGSAFTDDNGNCEIHVYVTERFGPLSIFCKSQISQNSTDKTFSISPFEVQFVPTETLPFSWLSKAQPFDEDKYRSNFLLWKRAKEKFVIRPLP